MHSLGTISTFRELERELAEAGIPTDRVGFYDHPSFVERERVNPRYLEKYAEYVRGKDYTVDYLDRSRAMIKELASYLCCKLATDGRMGACADLSLSASRMLDELGIWNYMIKGALTIKYDAAYCLPDVHFPLPTERGCRACAGHVWIAAPPFTIVDITIAHQAYTYPSQATTLPPYIVAEDAIPADYAADDVMMSETIEKFRFSEGHYPSKLDLVSLYPQYVDVINRFGCWNVSVPGAALRYVGVAISMSDEGLENNTVLKLCGMSALELFEEFRAVHDHE